MNTAKSRIVYLDYAATTPVLPEVVRAMEPYFGERFGNPGSIHKMGQDAQKAVDYARETIKNFVGASALREIIFTGSATEANNLAIFGVIHTQQPHFGSVKGKAHIITTLIEHESVLEPCRALEKLGVARATYLKPDHEGLISPEQIKEALCPETVLISIGYANNEIGVIQPISEIAGVIRDFRQQIANSKSRSKNNLQFAISSGPYFHTDAAQAAQFLDVNVEHLRVDLMTLSSHKLYGPKGIGALFVKDGVKLNPILYGGGQEYGLRSSTPNVPYIIGLAEALKAAENWKRAGGPEKIWKLRNYLLESLLEKNPGAALNGSLDRRLPNNINICLGAKTDGEALLIALSEGGICVSSGAACSARAQKPSHVIQALGKSAKEASASLRITLGRNTSKDDLDEFAEILAKKLKIL